MGIPRAGRGRALRGPALPGWGARLPQFFGASSCSFGFISEKERPFAAQ